MVSYLGLLKLDRKDFLLDFNVVVLTWDQQEIEIVYIKEYDSIDLVKSMTKLQKGNYYI